MGGEVAFSVKKDGVVQTRIVNKYEIRALSHPDFFKKGLGYFDKLWFEETFVCAPVDKGLVVVDLDQKWAMTNQIYGRIDAFDTNPHNAGISRQQIKNQAEKLFSQGRVKGVDYAAKHAPDPGEHFQDWWLRITRTLPQDNYRILLHPPRGWEFHDFHEPPSNTWHQVARFLLEKGVALTQDDWKAWDDFMEEKGLPCGFASYADHQVLDNNTPASLGVSLKRRV